MKRDIDATLSAYVAPIYEKVSGWHVGDTERGVLLEGSLAEGFGNNASDLDFLVVFPGSARPPVMPSVKFSDGRRIEVRQRGAEQLLAQFRRLEVLQHQPNSQQSFEDLLDRCQRFLGGLVLSDPGHVIQRVRDSVDAEQFTRLISRHWRLQARRSIHLACAAMLLEDCNSTRDWAQDCLHYCTKSWLAAQGETYVGRKWLQHQLDRAADHDISERFVQLAALVMRGQASDVLAAVHEFGQVLGVLAACDNEPDRIQLRRVRDATTWDIGGRSHIIQRRQRVFVLNSSGARVWRGLRFSRPLTASLVSQAATSCTGVPQFLHFLWRQGLIRLLWQGGEDLAGKRHCGAEPHADQPMVTLRGGRTDDAFNQPDAGYLPINAREFATAGMSLVWANIMIENAFEDIGGALEAGQLAVANWAFRRIVRDVGLAVLSARGVIPLPPKEEAASYVMRSPATPAEAREIIKSLITSGDAESIAGARETFVHVKYLVNSARRIMGFQDFPKSFDASGSWRETTDIGYDWVRIGAYLRSDFPIEDARDLLSRAGADTLSNSQPSGRSAGRHASAPKKVEYN